MTTDLGDLGTLATALGLFRGGSPNAGWFERPDVFLRQILSDPEQRAALLATIGELLGDSEDASAAEEPDGRTWLPIVEEGPFSLFVVIAEVESGARLHLGLGVRLRTAPDPTTAGARVDAFLPLFAASGSQSVADPLLLGTADGSIELALAIDLPGTADGIALRSVELGGLIPTDGTLPTLMLALRGLRMPGAASATDIVVDADSIDALGGTLLELVLGLAQAQAAGLGAADPGRALAGLLGLDAADDVPDFPIASLFTDGPIALARWWASALDGSSRSTWLDHLAALLGGSVSGVGADAAVRVNLGGSLALTLSIDSLPGAAGLPRVVPRIAVTTTGADGVSLALEVKPVSLDLATGVAVALPALSLTARIAPTGAGPLLGPVAGPGGLQLRLGSLEAGFATGADRRPVLVIVARDADVGSTHYDALDLTNADAIAAAGNQVVGDVAETMLTSLGTVGATLEKLLGLTGDGTPQIDPVRLLSDPIGAIRDRWNALLAEPPAVVRGVLDDLRTVVAAAGGAAVTGTGTTADPYRLRITDGLELLLTRDGSTVRLDLAAQLEQPFALGARARLDLRFGLLRAGLSSAAPSASFCTGLIGAFTIAADAAAPLELSAGSFALRLRELGARVAWTPDRGTRVDPWLSEPVLVLDGTAIALDGLLDAGLAVSGPAALLVPPTLPPDPAAWAASVWEPIESLAGAALDSIGALDALAGVTGWRHGMPAGVPRLSLAELLADPEAELKRWTRSLLGLAEAAVPGRLSIDDVPALLSSVEPLTRLLGLPVPTGGGLSELPWSIPLPGLEVLASLAGPDAARVASLASDAVQNWASGQPGLEPAALFDAVIGEAGVDTVLGDLLAGREVLAAGLDGLIERWAGTDGVVAVATAQLPTGLTMHRPTGLTHTVRLDSPAVAAAVSAAIGGAPRLIYVGVQSPGEPDLLPSAGDAAIAADLDLTAAGVPALSFPIPGPAAAGATVIRLPGKAAAVGPDGGAGFDAQVARLSRALSGLAPAGSGVVVVAGGAAGRVAVAAADGTGVASVVTVGTPWTPLSLVDVDAPPVGEALRLLRGLLQLADDAAAGIPDTPELELARALVAGLLARDERGDPLTELSAPELPLPAGLEVHAIVGTVSADAVRAAITALVSTAVDRRAVQRAAEAALARTAAALGVRLPTRFGTTAGGIRASLAADLDLFRAVQEDGLAALVGTRMLRLELRLAADGRWLVGGPDPARTPGLRPLALRALTIDLELPFALDPSAPTIAVASGRLVLHDASIFGVHRARWPIDLSETAALLPEVRALLGEVASALQREATATATRAEDEGIAALVDLLRASGVLGPDGGFDAGTLASLLTDPAGALATALADPERLARIAAALRAAAQDTRAGAGATIELTSVAGTSVLLDLAARSIVVSTVISSSGGPRLTVDARVDATAARLDVDLEVTSTLRLRGSLTTTVALAPTFTAEAIVSVGNEDSVIPLWPAGPATVDAVRGLLPTTVGSTILRLAIDALRETLAARPAEAAMIDALLDAVGLLDDAESTAAAGRRAVRWPAALLADARDWITDRAGGAAASVPALLDAARGMLAAPTVPGSIQLADGVVLRAAASADGLRIALGIDAAAFAGAPPPFALTADLGVIAGPTGRVVPDLDLSIGTDAGALLIGVGTASGAVDAAVGITVSLRPASRPEIVLFPDGRGLTAAADTAVAGAVAALPALLTQLASADPAGAPTDAEEVAARLVSRLGRALGLADGDPAVFDAATLTAFVADPVGALSTRASAMTADGLNLVVDAVDAALGNLPNLSASTTGGAVTITLGPVGRRVEITWNPGVGTVRVSVAAILPAIGAVSGVATVQSGGGLTELRVTVGPATVPIAGIVLAPFVRFSVGATGAVVDLGLGAGGSRVLARFDSGGLHLFAELGDPTTPTLATSPEQIARAVLAALLDLVGDVVLSLDAVRALLARPVRSGLAVTVGEALDGVLLAGAAFDRALVAELDEPGKLFRRLGVLASNLAEAIPPVTLGGQLQVSLVKTPDGADSVLGLQLSIVGDEWVLTPNADVRIGLVADGSWLVPATPASGLVITAMRLTPAGIEAEPGVVIAGLGIRISRGSGPLLDAGITIDALEILAYGEVGAAGIGGGAKIELRGLGLPLAAASGGDNALARGVMPAGGVDDDAPAPKFSPALAVQKHPGSGVNVRLSAGSGNGPWWLTIQREFGPIYLEQVGLEVVQNDAGIVSIGVLIDGKVSLFGFSAAVDDLSLTYLVNDGSPFEAGNWAVDVAGFAITAETGGLTLAGGLRKFTPAGGGVEYLGMLLARFGPYGITVYGGFGVVGPPADQYTSLFLFGAVNGPIGGVPAFFVTGIGGGFGVNRGLRVPADLSSFGDYPLIKALDPAARAGDPFAELEAARGFFPAERGNFWLAAGLSFTSFALVDGVAVIAVSFGNGVEFNLLGLARVALPRPQLAIVSIELALVARVSSSEGVILVQAQLTENSWLLAPAVRLTGGFAFAAWFAGANRGQFVLTMGGYHPDFHRDGYPVVPRLGIEWAIGDAVTVRGGAYFALTSEALMAGVKIEIHAQLGPAWAHLVLGADAIVFFDPFWLKATVYASIDAGVTIDLWFAEVTISVHISARITVTGPPFHAKGELEIGPVSVTLEIGDDGKEPVALPWSGFVQKYLEPASAEVGRALAAITGIGTIPPAGKGANGGAQAPDGQPDRPFRVVAEFTATVSSTIPVGELLTTALQSLPTSHPLSVAPMQSATQKPRLTVGIRVRRSDGTPDGTNPDFVFADGISISTGTGDFPIGVWGPTPDAANPVVPAGDMLSAVDKVTITAEAVIPGLGSAPDIPYRQVETGSRRMLPLLPSVEAAQLGHVLAGTGATRDALEQVRTSFPAELDDTRVGALLLADRGGRSPAAVTTWQAGLAAPVLLGSLGETLGRMRDAATVSFSAASAGDPPTPREPRILATLGSGEPRSAAAASSATGRTGTSVSPELLRRVLDGGGADRIAAPRVAAVADRINRVIPARLVRSVPTASESGRTVVATGEVPITGRGSTGSVGLAARTASDATLRSLATATEALLGRGLDVADGTIRVLGLPDAATDTRAERPALHCLSGRTRVVVTGGGGRVLADGILGRGDRIEAPVDSRNVVVVGGPPAASAAGWSAAAGWTADRPLPSASDGVLIAAGCVLNVAGRVPVRGTAPVRSTWVAPSELLAGAPAASTTIASPAEGRAVTAIAIAITGAGTEGIGIGIEGARQVGTNALTTDPHGGSVVVIAIEQDRPGAPIVVTVALDDPARQFGGLATVEGDLAEPAREETGVDWLARAVADRGLAAVVPPPTVPGPGTSTIRWRSA